MVKITIRLHVNLIAYRKFSNKDANPYKGPLFDPKPVEFLNVFGHISAKNGPIFIL